MAITSIVEAFGSRRLVAGMKPAVDLDWLVYGSDNEAEIMAAVIATYSTMDGMPMRSAGPTTQQGPKFWKCSTHYENTQTNRQTGDVSEFQFDTTGGRTKILQSISTSGKFGPGGATPPDLGGAIGWDGDTVQGTEITIPNFAFTKVGYFSASFVTDAYINTLYQATGTYNDAIFKGFPIGAVLFLGASGAQRGWGDWQISFKFAAQQAITTPVTIGGIGNVTKPYGWDYLWPSYQKSVGGTGATKQAIPKLNGIYTEQVYYPSDFSLLGIGTI